MIDWPNVLVGSLIALLIAAAFYFLGRRDYRRLANLIENRDDLKVGKNWRGKIISVEPANLAIEGQPVELRISATEAARPTVGEAPKSKT